MTTEIINTSCSRLTVGGDDCKNQIKKHKCSALTGECSGRKNGIGADVVLAEMLVEKQKQYDISVEKLIRHSSTTKGLGHLATPRGWGGHTSPTPFK